MSGVPVEKVVEMHGNAEVAHGVDREVAECVFAAPVDPSGCGTFTTPRMVAGLDETSDGVVAIDGTTVDRVAPEGRDVAKGFQNHALHPQSSVAENIAFGFRIHRTPKAGVEAAIRTPSASRPSATIPPSARATTSRSAPTMHREWRPQAPPGNAVLIHCGPVRGARQGTRDKGTRSRPRARRRDRGRPDREPRRGERDGRPPLRSPLLPRRGGQRGHGPARLARVALARRRADDAGGIHLPPRGRTPGLLRQGPVAGGARPGARPGNGFPGIDPAAYERLPVSTRLTTRDRKARRRRVATPLVPYPLNEPRRALSVLDDQGYDREVHFADSGDRGFEVAVPETFDPGAAPEAGEKA